jgi:hypothetical protein
MAPAFYERGSAAFHDEQPLIGAAVTIARAALGIARRDHHFGRLAPAVAECDPEAFSEPKNFTFHEVYFAAIR